MRAFEMVRSPSAAERVGRAARWLAEHGRAAEVVVVGATLDAAVEVTRAAATPMGASFGWRRTTLGGLAAALAEPALAAEGLAPIGGLSLEALCARLVHRARQEGSLGRFEVIVDRPGLPRALARSLGDLRLAGVDSASVRDATLASLLRALEEELRALRLADRAKVLETAADVARRGEHDWVGPPVLLLDVSVTSARERALVAALAARARGVLATAPEGDEATLATLAAIGGAEVRLEPSGPLAVMQRRLFEPDAADGASPEAARRDPGDALTLFSAPGESRECVEIARRILREAERGVPFDRMAVALRSPTAYRAPIEEALRRAGVPAHFARGATRPNPAGRAFLALLACASEGLRASRFAEYLSLGEVPDATADGQPPRAAPSSERWAPAAEDLIPAAAERARAPRDEPPPREADPRAPVVGGTLRTPRLWEKLLVDAAVIGGRERWARRIDGLARAMDEEIAAAEDPEDGAALQKRREREALGALKAYALPLLDELAALPREATWGTWIDRLGDVATRSLRTPDSVLATLAELQPMDSVGPVDLFEVRLVLEPRLGEVVTPPAARHAGRVLVASTDELRGMAFEVVFVPGLAERVFPQKVAEDPILPDADRAALDASLRTNAQRAALERLALRLAVGAARSRVVVSYPRLDLQASRPRTPSFYALEALRASEGALPGFEELAARADAAGGTRVGWPAPADPTDAIDDAEHDLALLDRLLKVPEAEAIGTANYLLAANPHLARALRARARRWTRKWTYADGLVDPAAAATLALGEHAMERRSYSATALQSFAACPYRFLLRAVHRLAPREEPAPIEALDPLQRGSLFHEAQYELHVALRDAGLLPVTPARLERARVILDAVLDAVAARFADDLAPAIARVWEDGIAQIRGDLRESLRRDAEDAGWTPRYFELAFGLEDRRERDAASRKEPAALDLGLLLRGAIDRVERREDGALRATDYKTGKATAAEGTVIGGGQTLQPVLYALALEKLVPGARAFGGRLYYCTSAGDYTERFVPLDEEARDSAKAVVDAVRGALAGGFFPAYPLEGACERCDYARVCGPYEEQRTRRKKRDLPLLVELKELRARP